MVRRKLATWEALRAELAEREAEWLRALMTEAGWAVRSAALIAETGNAQIYKLLRRHPKLALMRERKRRYDEQGVPL